MDDLNVFHVLAPTIEDTEHGVRLSAQDDVQSRTLVCFLDRNQALHFGLGYRNGSNLRVVCWEDNNRTNKTVPKGALIIAFDEETTCKATSHNFNAGDFGFTADWFNNDAQGNVRDELISLIRRQDRVADITERLAGLNIRELDVVIQKIDELKGNK